MKGVAFRRTRLVASALVLCTAVVIGASSPAGAGIGNLVVNPGTIEAGGQIEVSQYCWIEGGPVDVGVYPGWTGSWPEPTATPIVEQTGITPDVAGQWSVTLTIPADTAPGSYTVHGTCGEGQQDGYGAVELIVLASTATTTTTTMAPTTAGPTTTTAAPAPEAAAPVAARPTYTG